MLREIYNAYGMFTNYIIDPFIIDLLKIFLKNSPRPAQLLTYRVVSFFSFPSSVLPIFLFGHKSLLWAYTGSKHLFNCIWCELLTSYSWPFVNRMPFSYSMLSCLNPSFPLGNWECGKWITCQRSSYSLNNIYFMLQRILLSLYHIFHYL